MPTPERIAKITRAVAHRQKGLVVVLEDVHDPHNAEAVFRTCEAFGVHNVYLIFDEQDEYDPQAIGKSSSSSANKWLDYHVFGSTKECFDALKKDGYHIVGTALSDTAIPIFDADVTHDTIALVFGNEKRGLSKTAMDMADELLIIPMTGMIQSLNISVSAAICLFETCRQRKNKEGDYVLDTRTQEQLVTDLLDR